jgi:hypothetical protein
MSIKKINNLDVTKKGYGAVVDFFAEIVKPFLFYVIVAASIEFLLFLKGGQTPLFIAIAQSVALGALFGVIIFKLTRGQIFGERAKTMKLAQIIDPKRLKRLTNTVTVYAVFMGLAVFCTTMAETQLLASMGDAGGLILVFVYYYFALVAVLLALSSASFAAGGVLMSFLKGVFSPRYLWKLGVIYSYTVLPFQIVYYALYLLLGPTIDMNNLVALAQPNPLWNALYDIFMVTGMCIFMGAVIETLRYFLKVPKAKVEDKKAPPSALTGEAVPTDLDSPQGIAK